MKFSYGVLGDTSVELACLKIRKIDPNFTVLDVGASDKPWCSEVLTATLDLRDSSTSGIHFKGNINDARTWDQVLDYVAKNGKFSYSVCTHTLEDIAYPSLTLDMLPRVSDGGYITMPSLRQEMSRFEGPWRGYIHHRWIYTPLDGKLVLIPKVSFIEHIPDITGCPPHETELVIHWEYCDGPLTYHFARDKSKASVFAWMKEMYEVYPNVEAMNEVHAIRESLEGTVCPTHNG